VNVSTAGYAFARLHFPGRDLPFSAFLLQLLLIPPLLIVPNLATLVSLHLYDTLLGIMAPYFASAFGVFLMRQTFRAIPGDFEEAAILDGASIPMLIRHVLLPLARPGLVAFAIVSVTAHWNEFVWPLMAVSSPRNHVLTVGLASFASGAEAGSAWGSLLRGLCLSRHHYWSYSSSFSDASCLPLSIPASSKEKEHDRDHPAYRTRRSNRCSCCRGIDAQCMGRRPG
jgi:sn-glycerol 3-phosphate transport system permease protein